MLRNFVDIALFVMNLNYTIFVNFFSLCKKIEHQTLGCCSTHAQMCHAALVVFPVDFDGGEHVYRVHPINVQLVTDP
jgi:hypothetical protein